MPVVEECEAKLCSWGASKAVRIPKAVCDSLRLAVGSNLSISCGTDENGPFIMMRPAEESHRCYCDAPYVSIDSLFRGHEDASQPTEVDWGEDVGGEVME
jgi:antitoxin component of MazEF toxin-antitoxin module